jgi:multimeric flavodoxin WrbA
MSVVIVLGSRNPKGQTAAAAEALLQGLAAEGGEGELLFLPALKIERCRQCNEKGWGTCRSEGRCVIEDDFASVADKVKKAEAVVFATPVYFGDLSESLRAFLDRLRRTTRHEAAKEGITGKPAIGICVAGGGGGGAPSCALSLEKVLQTCGFDVLDIVPVRRQNLALKLTLLEAVGKWLARGPSS